jgi:hypothetical protein
MQHWLSSLSGYLNRSVKRISTTHIVENEGEIMIEKKLSIAEILLIAGTRVVLGAGIGLLLSGRLNDDQRKAAGVALALVGGLTTIPLAINVISKTHGVTPGLRSVA